MPQRKRPITERPKVEDESTGTGGERHGKHREEDEALPGSGGEKGGLNKQAGAGGARQNRETTRRERMTEEANRRGHRTE